MALIVKNYKHSKSDEIFDSVYLKIQKIITTSVDIEYFEDSTIPDIDKILKWRTELQNSVTYFVWVDGIARQSRTFTIDWNTINFPIDLGSDKNIYEQAYEYLKSKFEVTEDV